MKTNQVIPLVLILLLVGSVAYYTLDFDDKVSVVTIDIDAKDELELDIEREVESALREALSGVDEAIDGIDEAMEEVDEAMEEIDKALEEVDVSINESDEDLDELLGDLDAELRGIHRGLDDILDEVQREIETSEHIKIEREMSREEIEIVKGKVKSIVKRIIAEALDDEPELEDKP